ncbi:unnamed protein product [Linum tenue]|uniref:Uncharacterized protein n=1 Tax=Linum tenue TaxID=586396 RepID=A0AAV0M3C9_9ROSI|nr:unnamed protein product [Linum tenue]
MFLKTSATASSMASTGVGFTPPTSLTIQLPTLCHVPRLPSMAITTHPECGNSKATVTCQREHLECALCRCLGHPHRRMPRRRW